MKKIFTFLFILTVIGINAQYNINALNFPTVINFDDFKADSAAAPGAIRGINSNWFSIKGFTSTNAANNLDFGTVNTNSRLQLGTSTGGPTTSGIYSFQTDPADTTDRALGFQATANDLTPGFIYFKVKNTTPQTITSISFAFTLEIRNDQARSSNVQLYHGNDTVFANMILAATYISPIAADPSPIWVDTNISVSVTGLSLLPNAEYVFLIKTDDVGGSGSRDEFAINDLGFLAMGGAFTTVLDANFIMNDSTICEGSSVTFTNTTVFNPPSSNVIYIWNFGDGSSIASTANTTHQFDSIGSFTVVLYALDTATFSIDSAKKTVTVYEVPDATFGTTNNGSGSYTFTAPLTPSSNYTYNWTVNGSPAGTSQPTLNQTLSSGSYSVCLTVTNPLGPCTSLTFCDTVSVVILPPPSINLTLTDSVICKDDSAGVATLLVGGGTPPFTYLWTLNGNPIPPPTIGVLNQVGNAGVYNIAVTVTDFNNLSSTDSAQLVVLPLPNATFTATPNTINPLQYFVNFVVGQLPNYTLTVDGVQTPLIGAPPYLVTFPGNGAYAICLNVENPLTGCEDSTCQIVNINVGLNDIAKRSNIKMHPNPANDIIYIENVEGKSSINIYNSIGQIVKQEHINGNTKLNVKDLKAGVYFVEIKSNFGTQTVKLMIQ